MATEPKSTSSNPANVNTEADKQKAEQERAKAASATIAKYGSKSGAIRALLAEGKTRGEVAKFLNIRYQHVRNVDITPVKTPKAAPAPAEQKPVAETAKK